MTEIVVVGAGIAGLFAAEALRAEGFDGSLTVVGDESEDPYDRPPLSKSVLSGTVDLPDIALTDEEAKVRLGASWLTGVKVIDFDPGARVIKTNDGRRLTADGLVIATGTRARLLPAAEGWTGIHHLRTFTDACSLRDDLDTAEQVVVVGGGFIGTEVASAAATLGKKVTLIAKQRLPLITQLGTTVAQIVHDWHLASGVQILTDTQMEKFGGDGRVGEVILADGRSIPADVVVVGIGAEPNTEWLSQSGIQCDNGVLTDEWCRTTTRGVVAAGDVASYTTRSGRMRVEHWTNAKDMARAAAKTLVAELTGRQAAELPVHDPLPYVWSDQCGRRIQIAGRPVDGDEFEIVSGSSDAQFVGVYRRNGKVAAALGVDSPREFGKLRRQLRESWANR